MSIPALRQPKIANVPKEPPRIRNTEPEYVIVNLKDGKKLVVTSDAYHGLLTAGEMYRCVLCEMEMILEHICKEKHKQSTEHKKFMEMYPHVEEFGDNLIRKVNSNYYCTICNVIVLSKFLIRHLSGEAHTYEMQKAISKTGAYKPC